MPVMIFIGSPPLTRGKASSSGMLSCFIGITPAYAGKSLPANSLYAGRRDHPRLRGEKMRLIKKIRHIIGSPPLTRGKGLCLGSLQLHLGITPAYAGKSLHLQSIEKKDKDHPRLRGEKPKNVRIRSKHRGSPPLTRGKGQQAAAALTNQRITPAYAGKSLSRAKKTKSTEDHPRLRGEKAKG